jgi:hypothetical protein
MTTSNKNDTNSTKDQWTNKQGQGTKTIPGQDNKKQSNVGGSNVGGKEGWKTSDTAWKKPQ